MSQRTVDVVAVPLPETPPNSPTHSGTALVAFGAAHLAAALCSLSGLAADRLDWDRFALPFLIGIVALALADFIHACSTLSPRNAILFVALASGISFLVEYAGVRWSVFFGGYAYHPSLRPLLHNRVPLAIPIAWFVLAYPPVVYLRTLRIRVNGRIALPRMIRKSALCSVCLLAADIVLEPLAVATGQWSWREPGAYFGAPFGNFAGWLLVGLTVYATYFALERQDTRKALPSTSRLDTAFLVLTCAGMLTAALASWRHCGHWLPGLVGTLLALPYVLYAIPRLRPAPATPPE